MKAIPTTYRGVQFRSRLEAKWAAFFDQMGWRWEYEPIDLDGWAPDFLVTPKGWQAALSLYIEIKPTSQKGDPAFEDGRKKIEAAPRDLRCMILGISPVDGRFGWMCMKPGKWWVVSCAGVGGYDHVRRCWAAAANAVQWNAPSPGRPTLRGKAA